MLSRSLSFRKRVKFLEALSECGSVKRAAESAGVSYYTVKRAMATSDWFRKKVHEVKETALSENLEAEAYRRAVKGTEKVVVSMGRVVKHKGKPVIERTYSDSLLMFLMKGNMEKYGEKVDVTSKGKSMAPEGVSLVVGGKVVHRTQA